MPAIETAYSPSITDCPPLQYIPFDTEERDKALNLHNERLRLISKEGDNFREGLADQLTFYAAEFILKMPVSPYYYTQENNRLTSPNFPDQDMLVSYSQPYQNEFDANIESLRKVMEFTDSLTLQDARQDRQTAEIKGLSLLREKILTAPDNSFVIAVSPPYESGGYSVTYLGQVGQFDETGQNRRINMTACINHLKPQDHYDFLQSLGIKLNPKLNQYNDLGKNEDFVLSPAIIAPEQAGWYLNTSENQVELFDLAAKLYSFDPKAPEDIKSDFQEAAEKLRKIKKWAVLPRIPGLISLLVNQAPKHIINEVVDKIEKEAVKSYYEDHYQKTIPGYSALDYSQKDELLEYAANNYWLFARRTMPQNGGSCPSSQRNGLDIINSIANLAVNEGFGQTVEFLKSSSTFDCLRCHKSISLSKKPKKCPHCGAKTCFDPQLHKK